jgi:hypothetical protein
MRTFRRLAILRSRRLVFRANGVEAELGGCLADDDTSRSSGGLGSEELALGHCGGVDLAGNKVKIDIATVAFGNRLLSRAGRSRIGDWLAAERAIEDETQVLGLEIVRLMSQQAEAELPNCVDRVAGAGGNGMIDLGLGHGMNPLRWLTGADRVVANARSDVCSARGQSWKRTRAGQREASEVMAEVNQ